MGSIFWFHANGPSLNPNLAMVGRWQAANIQSATLTYMAKSYSIQSATDLQTLVIALNSLEEFNPNRPYYITTAALKVEDATGNHYEYVFRLDTKRANSGDVHFTWRGWTLRERTSPRMREFIDQTTDAAAAEQPGFSSRQRP